MKRFGNVVFVGGLLVTALLVWGCSSGPSEADKGYSMYRFSGLPWGFIKVVNEGSKEDFVKFFHSSNNSNKGKPLMEIEPVFMPSWMRDKVFQLGKDVEYTFHNGNVYVPRVTIAYPQDGYRVTYDVELFEDKYKIWRFQIGYKKGFNFDSEFRKKAWELLEAEKGKTFPYSHNQYIRMVAEDIGVIERKVGKDAKI